MSEEEIILYLKHTSEDDFNLEEHQKHNRYLAIQGLLDLYNKEKEKNKKCEYYEMVADELYKNSISKDKIREKIEDKLQYIGLLYQKNIIDNNQWKIFKDILEDLEEE